MVRVNGVLALLIAVGAGAGDLPARAQAPAAGSSAPAYTAAQMDALTAPIALYPDALILQIVQCAQSPYQVKQVNLWMQQNPGIRGTAAQDAAAKQGFDTAFVALVLFPDVIKMMADQADWTRDLGLAFSTDKDGLFASVQRLRVRAQAAGNLASNAQQQVQTVSTENGQQVIVIQPANPQIVYVPQYNPQVVYVQTVPTTTTVVTTSNNSGAVVGAALIGFAAGVIVGAVADDDDHHYYYAYGGWGYRGPVCYPGGWNRYYEHRENMARDFYHHRENMANDYYDHRQDMLEQRGENQANRREDFNNNRDNRPEPARGSNPATRDRPPGGPGGPNNLTSPDAPVRRASDRSAASRGVFGGTAPGAGASSARSGAFSGFQSGATERTSSARGRSSMSSSSASGGGGRARGGRGGGRR